jgi:hypothetical protein
LQPRSSALVVSLGLEHEAGVPRAYLRAWRLGADEATCVRHLRVFPVVAKPTTGAAAASTSSSSDPAARKPQSCRCSGRFSAARRRVHASASSSTSGCTQVTPQKERPYA